MNSPVVLESPRAFADWRKSVEGRSVGFVPTMGALHAGHETLMKRARAENEVAVLSVFVNPTQFNDPNDFAKYPVTWEADLRMARSNGIDAVFAPSRDLMYPDDYRYKVIETEFSKLLCGKDRPGHFDGVLTVVLKLLNLARPTQTYFGEKDYQQLSLIRGMAAAFFMDVRIVAVETVRERDGLAMSSRNVRLTAEQREKAPLIHQALTRSPTAEEAARLLSAEGFGVDYVTDREGRRFAAARLGDVRLIDNVEIGEK